MEGGKSESFRGWHDSCRHSTTMTPLLFLLCSLFLHSFYFPRLHVTWKVRAGQRETHLQKERYLHGDYRGAPKHPPLQLRRSSLRKDSRSPAKSLKSSIPRSTNFRPRLILGSRQRRGGISRTFYKATSTFYLHSSCELIGCFTPSISLGIPSWQEGT